MGILQSLSYTIHLLKKSFSLCLQKPTLFLFPLFSFLVFFLVELIVWFIVYLRFGIHIFNTDTLELWALISLWELSFFILFLIAPLYFLLMVNMLVMQVSTAHYLLMGTATQHPTAFASIVHSLKRLKIIVEYAWAMTIVIVDGETPLKQFLKKRSQEYGIADFLIQAKSDMWTEITTLMVPLIAIEQMTLKETIHDSENHMKETFGSGAYATFAFTELFIISSIFFCYFIEKIVSYIWNEAIGVAAIFFIIGLVLTIVLMAEGIFYSMIYQYCFNKPIAVFSREDVEKAFEKN